MFDFDAREDNDIEESQAVVKAETTRLGWKDDTATEGYPTKYHHFRHCPIDF